jgi:hypothetical protein
MFRKDENDPRWETDAIRNENKDNSKFKQRWG